MEKLANQNEMNQEPMVLDLEYFLVNLLIVVYMFAKQFFVFL
jgi:hypothetical protein